MYLFFKGNNDDYKFLRRNSQQVVNVKPWSESLGRCFSINKSFVKIKKRSLTSRRIMRDHTNSV